MALIVNPYGATVKGLIIVIVLASKTVDDGIAHVQTWSSVGQYVGQVQVAWAPTQVVVHVVSNSPHVVMCLVICWVSVVQC